MKIPGSRNNGRHIAVLILLLGGLLWGGLSFAASGGEGGHGAEGHASAEVKGGGGGGEGHGGAEAKGWAATDTYRVMNFAVLAAALIFLLKKPLVKALSGRIDGIRAQLDDLEARKSDAEKTLAEYNARISKLSKEAEDIMAEYVRQGNESKARILKEAELSARKLEEQARRNIENEFAVAKQRLQQEVFETAMIRAEEIIRKNITADDQNRLVDEYLDKVVAS
ncbi:MAG: ATP synthase F0 subunit B [Desulfobacteraceae bacterium]|nr:ATP synthase F0 subunit B [Desulfobacteraceae bacterium]